MWYSACFEFKLIATLATMLCSVWPSCSCIRTNESVEWVNLTGNVSKILDTLFDKYNLNIRPGFPGPPVKVMVDMSILSMGPVSEVDMELTLECYFRQSWIDNRLKFHLGHLETLSLNAVFMLEKMWRPDTYIKNDRRSYLHRLTVPNKLLRISTEGEVYVSQRLTIKARCPMHLKKFPMDTQACPLELGSLAYSNADVIYRWHSVTLADGIQLSQYRLPDILKKEKNQTARLQSDGTGEISILLVHFKLKREQGYYILQIYAPCMIIVALSWVSFWINKEASVARVTLGVMTVLTMSSVSLSGESYRNDLPQVSYSTALDVYIMICFSFVFLAMVEYAVINFTYLIYVKQMQRRAQTTTVVATSFQLYAAALSSAPQMQQAKLKVVDVTADVIEQADFAASRCADPEDKEHKDTALGSKRLRRNAACPGTSEQPGRMKSMRQRWEQLKEETTYTIVDRVDDVAKVGFPFAYFMFNVLYWLFYLLLIDDEVDEELMREYGKI